MVNSRHLLGFVFSNALFRILIALFGLLLAVFPNFVHAQFVGSEYDITKEMIRLNSNWDSDNDAGIQLRMKQGGSNYAFNVWSDNTDKSFNVSYQDSWSSWNSMGSYLFRVNSSGGIRIYDDNTHNNYTAAGHNGSNGYINSSGTGNLEFKHSWNTAMQINSSGFVGVGGDFNPTSPLHVKAASGNNPATNGLYLWQGGTSSSDNAVIAARVNGANSGDALVSFDVSGVTGWSVGMDNSDGDKFKIANYWNELGTNTHLSIETDGDFHFADSRLYGVRSIALQDWDDDGGAATENNWMIARDDAIMVYTGGFAVGNYGNNDWTSGVGTGNVAIKNKLSIATTEQTYKITIGGGQTGAMGFDNKNYLAAKNSDGTYENFFWPRWSDNYMYMNYGSAGFRIRNNSSTIALQMEPDGQANFYSTDSELATFSTRNANSTTAGITITGARNGCAGCATSYIGFKNYDDDLNSSYEYARIYTGRNNDALNNDGFMQFQTDNNGTMTTAMTIDEDQNIAIGTASVPSGYKMALAGKMLAQGVVVDASNWADYVFEEDYELPSLESVGEYIHENGHLPEVPTTAEVEENGVDLSQMQTTLLKKMEEMTLYMLEMNDKFKDNGNQK